MAGYVVAVLDVHDPEGFEDYRQRVPPTIERYGGRFLIRGGQYERLEGEWEPKRLTVVEFERTEAARRWYDSEEYRELRELRARTAVSNLLLVEGVRQPDGR
jgi:uncharacterized protein (DUF1330 family)